MNFLEKFDVKIDISNWGKSYRKGEKQVSICGAWSRIICDIKTPRGA